MPHKPKTFTIRTFKMLVYFVVDKEEFLKSLLCLLGRIRTVLPEAKLGNRVSSGGRPGKAAEGVNTNIVQGKGKGKPELCLKKKIKTREQLYDGIAGLGCQLSLSFSLDILVVEQRLTKLRYLEELSS